MLSCFRYKKLLMPYAEGALDEDKALQVLAHVERCSDCAEELDTLKHVSSALKHTDVPSTEPSPNLWSRVEAEISESRPSSRPWWQVKSFQVASSAVAVTILALVALTNHMPVQQSVPESARVSSRNGEIYQPLAPPKALEKTAEKPETQTAEAPATPEVEKTVPKMPISIGGPAKPASVAQSLERRLTAADKNAPVTELGRSEENKSMTFSEPVNRSPFSQNGKVPGGSQAAPVLGDRSDYDTSTGRVTGYGAKAPVAAAPAAAPGSIGGKLKEEPVRVAQADNIVCNVSPTPASPAKPLEKKKASRVSSDDRMGLSFKERSSLSLEDRVSENEKALKDNPNDTKAMQFLAYAYKRNGQVEKRVEMLERLSKVYPQDARNWLTLGHAYAEAGKKDKAKEAVSKANELGDESVKREASEYLEKLK